MLFQRISDIFHRKVVPLHLVHGLCTKSKRMDSRAKGQEYDKRRTATRESTALFGVLL